jgi:hypothetical protein
MVIASAGDTARARPHFVERTDYKCGGPSIGDQHGGGHPMVTSIFTEHALQDLRD